jgi:hypothetical protein
MAFLLPRSVFIHIPKTGGQWAAAALKNAGLLCSPLGVVHASPDEIAHEESFRLRAMAFAVVRHPLTWYQSIWAHRMDDKWGPMDAPDWFTPRWMAVWADFTKKCRADTFEEFVHKCADAYPEGFLSNLYDVYTEGCAFIGRQERLVDDLLSALELAGEQFQEGRIRETRRRNVRGHHRRWSGQCRYTPELADTVVKVEARAIATFGYEDIPEEIYTKTEYTTGGDSEAEPEETLSGWAWEARLALEEFGTALRASDVLILVDGQQLGIGPTVARCRCIPFLERNGQYWGNPADDETAIRELERLRREGASFIAFAWPAFWWLDYYSGFHDYLRSQFPCVLQNERLVVFDLRR